MRATLLLLIMSLTATILHTDASAQAPAPNGPRYGGRLVWGTHTKPTAINPLFTTRSISVSLQELIFNKLVRFDASGKIVPDLAQRWTVSADGLRYIFYLRKGVRFHDGVELTASDVKFTYDALRDERNASPLGSWYRSITGVRVLDPYTLELVLAAPSASFLMWIGIEIVPKHLLEGADLRRSAFNARPVGTGPFRFKSWAPDDTITLESNADYYEGRPYLDEIVVKTYADSTEMWGALMRGSVDYAGFIEQADYEILRRDPSFKAYALPSDGYYALVFNMRDPVLADIRVRQAIALGIDRDNLIERVAQGYGAKCDGPLPLSSIGLNPAAQPAAYNPDEARMLLAEAGWHDGDRDGILEKAGEPLALTVLVDARSETHKRIAMVLRQQLLIIGVQVKVVEYHDENELTQEFLGREKVQAYMKFILGGMFPEQTKTDWGSKQSKRDGVLWPYANEKVGSLYQEADMAVDAVRQQAIYQRLYERIVMDFPAGFLYYPYAFYAVNARFANTDAFFSEGMPVYSIKDWYITGKGVRAWR